MILLIGGEKGGTGKSTLATNISAWLALQGKDVLLLDTDRQGTATAWVAERSAKELPQMQALQRFGNVHSAVKDLAKRYGEIVIDAGGRDSEELRSAMVAADVLLSPLRASQFDLWTASHMADLVKMARALNPRLGAYFVLTMCPTHSRATEATDSKDLLAEIEGITLAETLVYERKAFRDAVMEGRGVVEMGDTKAAAEIEALAKEIYR